MSLRETGPHAHVAPSSARDVLVALRNLEHLARSPRVGHEVVVGLLPEVREGLSGLAGFFREMLERASSPGADLEGAARGCGVGEAGMAALARVAEALDLAAGARQRSASARLRLERMLGEEVPKLEGCVEVCELWQRALGSRRAELELAAVVASVLAPCSEAEATVWAVLPDHPLAISADAAVVVWLLRCALAGREGGTLVARAARSDEPDATAAWLEVRATHVVGVGAPMVARLPAPRVVYGDAVARVAAAAEVRLVVSADGMSFGF